MKKTILYISLLLFFASCEKVVVIDLNEANPRIVVDAAVVNYNPGFDGDAIVRLSWTSSFYESNSINPIDNAQVKITDANGISYNLAMQTNGIYRNPNLPQPQMGDKYKLEVSIDGKTFTSTSMLQRQVKIDSLSYMLDNFGPKQGESYIVNCHFTDPPGEDNYYYLKIKINNEYQSGYYLSRDDAQDGKPITYSFFRNYIKEPSNVVVELYTLDEASFEYFKVLAMMDQGGMSTAPGNPPTNIEGDAIGVFRAVNMQDELIMVP